MTLKKGETVRVELGAHVDGYVSEVAHTIVVGASKVCYEISDVDDGRGYISLPHRRKPPSLASKPM